MKSFLSELSERDKEIVNQMRDLIMKMDIKVIERTGNIMSSKNCFIYDEEGVFKYGLAKTKNHFSFHSMIMYSNEDVRKFITSKSKNLKIQKGCINFNELGNFSIDLFEEFLKISAKADFSPVITHYKKKK